jgi:hypothetical protein
MTTRRSSSVVLRLLAAASAAAVIVLSVGCGGDDAPEVARLPTTTPPATTSAGDASGEDVPGIRYARCLREHGVDVRDPGPDGNVVIERPDTPRAVVERAQRACQQLLPAGHQLEPEERDRTLAAMTKFTRCMRAEEIPMADPFTGPAGGVGFRVPSGVNPLSQKYKSAEAACRHHLPGRP